MTSFTKGGVRLKSTRLRIMMALVGLCNALVYRHDIKAMIIIVTLKGVNAIDMGQVMAILRPKYNHQDLLTGEFHSKCDQHHFHTHVIVHLISFSGLHLFSIIIVEPSMHQLGCENVRDHDETTIPKLPSNSVFRSRPPYQTLLQGSVIAKLSGASNINHKKW
jgi:hypothetical protein